MSEREGLTREMEQIMQENAVPKWYIDSCKNKYMFQSPCSSLRYNVIPNSLVKVYFQAFYTLFHCPADDFDASLTMKGPDRRNVLNSWMPECNYQLGKECLNILEVVLEMYLRNISFVPLICISLMLKDFLLQRMVRPPLNALQGVGVNAARSIVEARNQGVYSLRT